MWILCKMQHFPMGVQKQIKYRETIQCPRVFVERTNSCTYFISFYFIYIHIIFHRCILVIFSWALHCRNSWSNWHTIPVKIYIVTICVHDMIVDPRVHCLHARVCIYVCVCLWRKGSKTTDWFYKQSCL